MVSSTSGAPRAHKHVAAAVRREVGEVAVAGSTVRVRTVISLLVREHRHWSEWYDTGLTLRYYGPHPMILRASPWSRA